MTKREICERLIKTRDYLSAYEKLLLKDNCPFDADDLGACADALRDLILDLAATETEEEKKESVCVRCGGNLLPCAKPDLLYCRKCDKVFAKEELKHEEAKATKGKRPSLIVFRKKADE